MPGFARNITRSWTPKPRPTSSMPTRGQSTCAPRSRPPMRRGSRRPATCATSSSCARAAGGSRNICAGSSTSFARPIRNPARTRPSARSAWRSGMPRDSASSDSRRSTLCARTGSLERQWRFARPQPSTAACRSMRRAWTPWPRRRPRSRPAHAGTSRSSTPTRAGSRRSNRVWPSSRRSSESTADRSNRRSKSANGWSCSSAGAKTSTRRSPTPPPRRTAGALTSKPRPRN